MATLTQTNTCISRYVYQSNAIDRKIAHTLSLTTTKESAMLIKRNFIAPFWFTCHNGILTPIMWVYVWFVADRVSKMTFPPMKTILVKWKFKTKLRYLIHCAVFQRNISMQIYFMTLAHKLHFFFRIKAVMQAFLVKINSDSNDETIASENATSVLFNCIRWF